MKSLHRLLIILALFCLAPLALAAAQLGVCLHAEAADIAAKQGERGLLASDLIAQLPGLVNP